MLIRQSGLSPCIFPASQKTSLDGSPRPLSPLTENWMRQDSNLLVAACSRRGASLASLTPTGGNLSRVFQNTQRIRKVSCPHRPRTTKPRQQLSAYCKQSKPLIINISPYQKQKQRGYGGDTHPGTRPPGRVRTGRSRGKVTFSCLTSSRQPRAANCGGVGGGTAGTVWPARRSSKKISRRPVSPAASPSSPNAPDLRQSRAALSMHNTDYLCLRQFGAVCGSSG